LAKTLRIASVEVPRTSLIPQNESYLTLRASLTQFARISALGRTPLIILRRPSMSRRPKLHFWPSDWRLPISVISYAGSSIITKANSIRIPGRQTTHVATNSWLGVVKFCLAWTLAPIR